ncbi:conjugal transfer protein TraD [Phenylobacterium sp. J367]|uniref:conjugal transfer protein TraD n=1 Tax=Phenylobacterium sp. J367 TaxID=2898435 RepID=UPI002151AA6D|nr:conjugal transfer protein TraD [Phenylobacterium sp. J367]MCR5877293.1 conjugal transfer protein TraD [Phenylobacterium sp. J367]
MKKPRDLDAELQALQQRAKALKGRRVTQFGELVIASGADKLDMEILAGALLAAGKADASTREGWRRAGAAFFQGQARSQPKSAGGGERRAADGGGAAPG